MTQLTLIINQRPTGQLNQPPPVATSANWQPWETAVSPPSAAPDRPDARQEQRPSDPASDDWELY